MSDEPKLGHEFKFNGIDPVTGKERVDIVITSRHDLMKYATDKRMSNAQFIAEDSKWVWTPFGRDMLNPEYIQRAHEVKALSKMFKNNDKDRLLFDHKSEQILTQFEDTRTVPIGIGNEPREFGQDIWYDLKHVWSNHKRKLMALALIIAITILFLSVPNTGIVR